MKKIKSLSVLFVLFSALTLISCDTEPVDPVLTDNIDPENPGTNPGTDPGTDPGTSEGDYFPMALNNEWVFALDGVMQDPMKITGTVTVNNKSYYKINQFFSNAGSGEFTGSAVMLLRKDGGNYSVRVSVDIPVQEGMSISVSPFEYIILKDNLAVGETWTETTTQTTSYDMPESPVPLPDVVMNLTFNGKILEKGVTAVVNGVTYNDVIKMNLKQTSVIEGFGEGVPPTITNTEVWFAKNIGPIKAVSTSEGFSATNELQSYVVN
jgi:hypothetical protein